MNREEKAQAIEEIAAQIEGAEAIFAIDYRGISVTEVAELRAKLREADASFRVVKNRLTKRAADQIGEDRLPDLLEGPTALTFIRGDTAQAAKAIASFNQDHEVLSFKGGFMAGLTLDEEKFKSIARLPGREVLDGQLAGVVASPLTGLVRGLGSMLQGLALQLGQMAERELVGGDATAAEAEEPSGSAAADGGPADAPVEEEPTESGAEAEAPAAEDPSKPEGEADETAETTAETEDEAKSEEEEE